jgi:MFS family permease
MVPTNSVLKHFNKSLLLACMLIAVSTFNFGFDNAGFNTTQAMDGFQHQFGRYNSTTGRYFLPPAWLSMFNSLNYIGFGAGVILGSLVSARWGRRMCMFTMSVYAVITATIAITSTTREQIMAARVLNCMIHLADLIFRADWLQTSTLAWNLRSSRSTSPR